MLVSTAAHLHLRAVQVLLRASLVPRTATLVLLLRNVQHRNQWCKDLLSSLRG
jgi:hypothetical protein